MWGEGVWKVSTGGVCGWQANSLGLRATGLMVRLFSCGAERTLGGVVCVALAHEHLWRHVFLEKERTEGGIIPFLSRGWKWWGAREDPVRYTFVARTALSRVGYRIDDCN